MITLSNEVVLVTGGAGNIGSFIIDAVAAQEPTKVICVDNLFNGKLENLNAHLDHPSFSFYNLDISDYSSLEYLFAKHRPTRVFHQASMLIQDSETLPNKAVQSNIVGTFNVIQLCNELEVRKVCFASSASVFGQPRELPVEEDHPFDFENNYLYGATKIANEALMGAHAKFDWVGLRYYNVYSERQSISAFYTQVINYLYENIEAGNPVELHNDGSQTVDLIHAQDIADVNVSAMTSGVSREYFNVGTGVQTKVLDLARQLMEVMGKQVEISFIAHKTHRKMVTMRQSSIRKMADLLNFKPRISIEEGLSRIVRQRRSGGMDA